MLALVGPRRRRLELDEQNGRQCSSCFSGGAQLYHGSLTYLESTSVSTKLCAEVSLALRLQCVQTETWPCAHPHALTIPLRESESVLRVRCAVADQLCRNTAVFAMLDVKHTHGEIAPWPVF